jgi:hypothetical protein
MRPPTVPAIVFRAAAICVGIMTLAAVSAIAQSGEVTISTDRSQYQVGDTAQVCYTVAGPGPMTISDFRPSGASQTFLVVDDDGRGDCVLGMITPPTGNECLEITAASGGVTGTSRTCFQVVVPPAPASSGSVQDCGQVSILGGHVTSTGTQTAENCFYQAYQQCLPAMLRVSISGVDAGTRHSFSLASSGNTCVITDSAQNFVVPRPPLPPTTSTCSGLTQTPDGGLLFSSCGGEDVAVPSGA